MTTRSIEGDLRHAAISLTVFGAYLLVLSVTLMTVPNALLAVFGISPTQEPWIRIVGLLAGLIGFLYVRYAPHADRAFCKLTVQARASVVLFFLAFVLFTSAPWQLLLFGMLDLAGAGWTWWALVGHARIATA